MRTTITRARSAEHQDAVKRTRYSAAFFDQLRGARALLLIGVVAVLGYANSLGGEFVFDDTDQIVQNQNIRSWNNLAKAFVTHVWAFRERAGSLDVPPPLPYYRPLFTAILTIDYHFFGLWPQGWHLMSLTLHILCTIGVFYVILLSSGRQPVALIASAIFAVHPVHSESVAWISGMTDPLFTVFFLTSFCLYLRSRSGRPEGGRLSYGMFVMSLVMFTLAAFAKETALSLVLLVFGYEFIGTSVVTTKRLLSATRGALPFVGAALIYLVARYLVLGELMWRNPQAPERPFAYTLLTLPLVICAYARHLLWPFGLSVAYNTHFVTTAASAEFVLPAVVLSVAAIALLIYRKRISREVWQSLLLIAVPLLPVLNLGQVSRAEYLVFDHYLYLSVAGFGYLIAIGISKIGGFESAMPAALGVRRSLIAVGLSCIIVIGSALATARENSHWSDSYSLWSNVADVNPDYWAAHYNRGLALLDAKRFQEARASLELANTLKPDEADVLDALGRSYDGLGDTANAVANFKRAIEIDSEIFESYNNLGTIYFKTENYNLAEANFTVALRLKPEATASRFNLSLCYSRQGRYSEAAQELERVTSSAPDDAEAFYELGLAYERLGRRNDAARNFSRGRQVAQSAQLAAKLEEALSRLQDADRSH